MGGKDCDWDGPEDSKDGGECCQCTPDRPRYCCPWFGSSEKKAFLSALGQVFTTCDNGNESGDDASLVALVASSVHEGTGQHGFANLAFGLLRE